MIRGQPSFFFFFFLFYFSKYSYSPNRCRCMKYRPFAFGAVTQRRIKVHMYETRQHSVYLYPLRKHAYTNILKILPSKNEIFQIKNSDIFHISAQNIDCGYSLEPPRRGGSNEYPQSMFLSRNKKNNVYPCKPQFYYIKMGFEGVNII